MIQIKAPDGSIVQFPDGTGDDVITGVMARNYPAPAPDLSSVAAGANAELVQQPGVIEARAPADLAALTAAAPAPTSWMDTLRNAVTGGPDGRGIVGTVDQGVRGVAQGVTTLAALPVDAAAMAKGGQEWLAEKAGIPERAVRVAQSFNPVLNTLAAAQPYVGSETLHGYMDSANRATADTLGVSRPVEKPQNIFERGSNRVGQEVGAAMLPVAGAISKGVQIGVDAARKLPTLARMFVEPAAIDAGKFAAKEGGTAVAAGMGAAGANELSRAAGVDEKSGWHAATDIAGALTGAGVLGTARMVAKPIGDIWQALFSRDKFSNNTVKENVVDRIINNADSLPKTEGQAVDTAPLVDAINRGARVDETIPGFKDSIADRTGDPGLAALEYGRQSGQGAGAFTARRAENTAAVDTAMNRNAPDGNPADLRAELEIERGRRLTDANVQTRNASRSVTPSTTWC